MQPLFFCLVKRCGFQVSEFAPKSFEIDSRLKKSTSEAFSKRYNDAK
jgi:hypothetical protein